MSLAFFAGLILSSLFVYLVYRGMIFIEQNNYKKALYCFSCCFSLCGAAAFLFIWFTDFIVHSFSGAVLGFILAAVGGFLFKQFCPYTITELFKMTKYKAKYCYGKLKIYIPKVLKFLKNKANKMIYYIKNRKR